MGRRWLTLGTPVGRWNWSQGLGGGHSMIVQEWASDAWVQFWLLILNRWQVYHIARSVGKVVRFQHRWARWWTAPFYQNQLNRSELNNWLYWPVYWYMSCFICYFVYHERDIKASWESPAWMKFSSILPEVELIQMQDYGSIKSEEVLTQNWPL